MQISVSSQTTLLNLSNYFVFALYDATAPTVLLESQQPPKPYGNPLQISFTYNCSKGHIYIIKLWESPDNTPTGVVRNSFSQAINSNINSVSIKMDEYLEVDVTSGLVSGATSYSDTSWAGWNYWVVRNPNTMIPDSTDNTNPDYHQNILGGFNLIQLGDTFQPHERFEVHFIPQVITTVDTGAPSPLFSTGRIITANTTLSISDKGQALQIQGASSRITLTLPALSTIADFNNFYFYSCGGSHINAVFALPGTDKILYNGSLRSQLILGQSESLRIYKAFGVWNVEGDLPGVLGAGELVYNYANPKLNTLLCDGSLKLRADYPRLWEWVQQLSAASVVSDSAWTSTFITVEGVNYYTKIGCFSTGDGTTNFRLPLIVGFFIRPIDGTGRAAGSFEVQTIQTHKHDLTPPTSQGQTGYGKMTSGNEADEPTPITFTTAVYGASETKPSNIGAYALIRI